MKNNLNKQLRKRKIAATARDEYAAELAKLIDQSFDGMKYSELLVQLNMFMGVFAEEPLLMQKLISMRDQYRLREMFARDEEENERKRHARHQMVIENARDCAFIEKPRFGGNMAPTLSEIEEKIRKKIQQEMKQI